LNERKRKGEGKGTRKEKEGELRGIAVDGSMKRNPGGTKQKKRMYPSEEKKLIKQGETFGGRKKERGKGKDAVGYLRARSKRGGE